MHSSPAAVAAASPRSESSTTMHLLGFQAIAVDRRQVRLGVRLSVPVIFQRHDEIQVLAQAGPGMGDLEMLATSARHDAHSDAAMQDRSVSSTPSIRQGSVCRNPA